MNRRTNNRPPVLYVYVDDHIGFQQLGEDVVLLTSESPTHSTQKRTLYFFLPIGTVRLVAQIRTCSAPFAPLRIFSFRNTFHDTPFLKWRNVQIFFPFFFYHIKLFSATRTVSPSDVNTIVPDSVVLKIGIPMFFTRSITSL